MGEDDCVVGVEGTRLPITDGGSVDDGETDVFVVVSEGKVEDSISPQSS